MSSWIFLTSNSWDPLTSSTRCFLWVNPEQLARNYWDFSPPPPAKKKEIKYNKRAKLCQMFFQQKSHNFHKKSNLFFVFCFPNLFFFFFRHDVSSVTSAAVEGWDLHLRSTWWYENWKLEERIEAKTMDREGRLVTTVVPGPSLLKPPFF